METNQTNVQEFILSDSGQQFIIEETISVDEPQTWIITTDVLPSEAHEEILSPVTTSSSSPSVTTTHYRPIVMKVPEPPPEPIPVSEHYKQVLQEQIPTCYAEVATASLSQLSKVLPGIAQAKEGVGNHIDNGFGKGMLDFHYDDINLKGQGEQKRGKERAANSRVLLVTTGYNRVS
ncbi:uncharacterized protein [Lepeophtheirus salmonis]|uniref:uncharacterized protein isoform X2 n=1 Tax=Lepeophtheirus salmonis TaxID=72036 RepID=UPI001AE2B031|nr:uncharacterized protein LOC121127291 isoform X2 [Lepeophtheirus salmonis]